VDPSHTGELLDAEADGDELMVMVPVTTLSHPLAV
jgi:hypothetical protein